MQYASGIIKNVGIVVSHIFHYFFNVPNVLVFEKTYKVRNPF